MTLVSSGQFFFLKAKLNVDLNSIGGVRVI